MRQLIQSRIEQDIASLANDVVPQRRRTLQSIALRVNSLGTVVCSSKARSSSVELDGREGAIELFVKSVHDDISDAEFAFLLHRCGRNALEVCS